MYGIKKSSNWLRFTQVGLGTISIILSIIVLTGVAIYSIIVLLSIALLMIGIERIATGIAAAPAPVVSKSPRVASIGLGALVIIFSSVIMSFPLHTPEFLILLGALAYIC